MPEQIVAILVLNIHELHSIPKQKFMKFHNFLIVCASTQMHFTYKTEDVMATVELFRKLIERIVKVFETIFP